MKRLFQGGEAPTLLIVLEQFEKNGQSFLAYFDQGVFIVLPMQSGYSITWSTYSFSRLKKVNGLRMAADFGTS